jgi:phospholipase C
MSLPLAPCIASAIRAIAWVHAETVVAPPGAPRATVTPIEHLIVVVGENLSFDNLFATYEPAAGQSVGNLLSRGIVNKDGGPGPRFAEAAQREANVRDRYSVTPPTGAAFAVLPQPSTNYAKDLPH